jgi:cysteine desulfurase
LKGITEIEVNSNGCVEVSNVIDAIKPNTILISIMLANNETGVIQVYTIKIFSIDAI